MQIKELPVGCGTIFPYITTSLLDYVKVLLLSLHDKDSPSVCLQLTEQARQQTAVASNSSPHKEAPSLSLAELLGVAVGVFSLVGEKGCLRSGLEETRLKEALADLAMQWRSCDINFLGALGIGETL